MVPLSQALSRMNKNFRSWFRFCLCLSTWTGLTNSDVIKSKFCPKVHGPGKGVVGLSLTHPLMWYPHIPPIMKCGIEKNGPLWHCLLSLWQIINESLLPGSVLACPWEEWSKPWGLLPSRMSQNPVLRRTIHPSCQQNRQPGPHWSCHRGHTAGHGTLKELSSPKNWPHPTKAEHLEWIEYTISTRDHGKLRLSQYR